MQAIRLIEGIRSGLGDPATTAAEVRSAARLLEEPAGPAEVFEALLGEDLTAEAVRLGAGLPAPERRAWLTLAAAGAARARQCLAWRACQVLDVDRLAAALGGRRPRRTCRRRAGGAAGAEERAAWLLLASLDVGDLRRLACAHPVLGGRLRRLGAASGMGRSARRGRAASAVLG